jgi:hypothetical protein
MAKEATDEIVLLLNSAKVLLFFSTTTVSYRVSYRVCNTASPLPLEDGGALDQLHERRAHEAHHRQAVAVQVEFESKGLKPVFHLIGSMSKPGAFKLRVNCI